jgi:hypothetical protein
MSDLRDSLNKQRELEKQYQDYGLEKDKLATEERKELRKDKSHRNIVSALSKAADAIGKIGASQAGGLVSGDLVPEINIGAGEAESISDKFDDERLALSEKAKNLRDKVSGVQDERALAKEAKRLEKQTEKLKAKEAKEIEKETLKYNSSSRKIADKMVKQTLIDDVEKDIIDGADTLEILEEKGVPQELLVPFQETINKWGNEDEKLQARTLTELKQELRKHFIKKRVVEDMEDGKKFSPKVLKALGLINEESQSDLTTEPESAKVEESAPETAPAGEPEKQEGGGPDGNPNTFFYQIKLPDGSIKNTPEITAERAEDIREVWKKDENKKGWILERAKR